MQDRECHRCYYSQTPAVNDPFYKKAVRPYTWISAVCLFLSYVIGLLFTLRTHAAVIWSSEIDEKKAADMSGSHLSGSGHFEPHHHHSLTRQATSSSIAKTDIRNSQLYKRIVGQSYQEIGLGPDGEVPEQTQSSAKSDGRTPHMVPPKDTHAEHPAFHLDGLSDEASQSLMRHITEIAATTSAIATRDATKSPHRAAQLANMANKKHGDRPHHTRTPTQIAEGDEAPPGHTSGGHDAPNWSRTKSAVILLTATLAYAIIAEILVNTVDAVLQNSRIDEKFLGITLFALVPNTTEFLVSILPCTITASLRDV
jgi:Ca2+:H+ antiporter